MHILVMERMNGPGLGWLMKKCERSEVDFNLPSAGIDRFFQHLETGYGSKGLTGGGCDLCTNGLAIFSIRRGQLKLECFLHG
jgi:hypothetical protein